MASAGEVLAMLIPTVELSLIGDNYEDINWFGKEPAITKAQFQAGFAQYEAWKGEQDTKAGADKAALLARLGITADEAKMLLS